MAYDMELAGRVRASLSGWPAVSERKMFGGIAFMLDGNMVCGVIRDDLMVRVGPVSFEAALKRPGARLMDFTGRPSRGMVFVGPEGYETEDAFQEWLRLATTYVAGLPAKEGRGRGRRAR